MCIIIYYKMEYIINDLTESQINTLNKYNTDDLINVLHNLNNQKEKRNSYHRLYYNKFKEDESKLSKIKESRKDHYMNLKNDAEKYKAYLNKMKIYNKSYMARKIKTDDKHEQSAKKKKINYIDVDDDLFIINITRFINNFDDLEYINKKFKQLLIHKKDVDEIFITDDAFNEENIKNYILNKYNNIIKMKT